jgi:hypothetical protein
MTIPLWVLLGFAGWTLTVLMCTVGVYRWSRILTGRAKLNEFPADLPHGDDWYRRAIFPALMTKVQMQIENDRKKINLTIDRSGNS